MKTPGEIAAQGLVIQPWWVYCSNLQQAGVDLVQGDGWWEAGVQAGRTEEWIANRCAQQSEPAARKEGQTHHQHNRTQGERESGEEWEHSLHDFTSSLLVFEPMQLSQCFRWYVPAEVIKVCIGTPMQPRSKWPSRFRNRDTWTLTADRFLSHQHKTGGGEEEQEDSINTSNQCKLLRYEPIKDCFFLFNWTVCKRAATKEWRTSGCMWSHITKWITRTM